MKNGGLLHYKGYTARPEYSAGDRVFYGTILGISNIVDFQSESAKDLEDEFHKAVDDYLELCAEIGKEPQKEYSGLFNVRIPPELHREEAILDTTGIHPIRQSSVTMRRGGVAALAATPLFAAIWMNIL